MSYFKDVRLTDGTTAIEVETVDGNKYLGVSTLQDVHVSAANSSTANLASGATFTGTSQSSLGIAGIQINLHADQNCTVYVDQSTEGSNWDITDSFTYYYANGGASWTVQATASYLRIRVTNNGAATTTEFRLQTALCPIVEAVPRSLSAKGNLKTAINELLGTFGTQVLSTPMGDLRTADHVRLVGATFTGTTFDTNFWTKTSQTGTGDATLASGQMTLATGVTANSSIVVNSVRTARYVGGTSNYYRGIIRCPSITGTNVRRWGAFDVNDGFFFSHNGTTLSLVCRKAASDTNIINSGSFNGEQGSVYSLDANVHTYEIYWTNSSAWFIIDGLILHKFSGSTAPLTNTLTLKVGSECTNSGGTASNNTLEVRVSTLQRLGPLLTQPTYANISTNTTTVLKYGAGTLHRIVINKVGLTNNTLTIYDNTTGTGTTIATITMAKGTQASDIPVSVDYGSLAFSTGLTIVTATGTAPNVTVVYE